MSPAVSLIWKALSPEWDDVEDLETCAARCQQLPECTHFNFGHAGSERGDDEPCYMKCARSRLVISLLLRLNACPKLQASLFGGPGSAVRTSERHVGYMGAPHPRPRLQRPRIGAGARWMRGWDVSRHDIAGIWVAFFQECQQYRRGQG